MNIKEKVKNKIAYNCGFTLIESIIYIGIFSFIMTGSLVAIYSIISSSARNQSKAMANEEGTFLINKIDWALSGTKTASINTNGEILTIEKFDTPTDNPIVISITNEKMSIKRGNNISKNLNNSNTIISCPQIGCFTKQLPTDLDPKSIQTQFTITTKTSEGAEYSQGFTTIKFIRNE